MIAVLIYILVLVEAVVSFLLVGVILIQKTKAQGMGLAFGAGMGETLFGAQVGNVLTRTTVILAIVFLVNTTLLAVIGTTRRATSVADAIEETSPIVPAAAPAAPWASPAAPPAPIPTDAMPIPTPAPVTPAETDAGSPGTPIEVDTAPEGDLPQTGTPAE